LGASGKLENYNSLKDSVTKNHRLELLQMEKKLEFSAIFGNTDPHSRKR